MESQADICVYCASRNCVHTQCYRNNAIIPAIAATKERMVLIITNPLFHHHWRNLVFRCDFSRCRTGSIYFLILGSFKSFRRSRFDSFGNFCSGISGRSKTVTDFGRTTLALTFIFFNAITPAVILSQTLYNFNF